MKNICLYIITGLVCTAIPVVSQTTVQSDGLEIIQNKIYKNGDSLKVDFVVDYSNLDMASQEQLILEPLLINENDTLSMPYLLLAGKKRDKANYRQETLYGEDREMSNSHLYKSVRVGRHKPQQIKYNFSLPFGEWMYGAHVDLERTLSGCADCQQKLPSLLIGSVEKAAKEYSPQVMFIVPEVENVKMRQERGEAFLNFKQGQSVILPDFADNTAELNQIDDLLNKMLNDKNITCKGIELTGYASPEGSYALNTRLAKERADALKKYIEKRKVDCPVSIKNGSEDWDGLRKWLQNSTMQYKTQLIEIIDEVKNPDSRDAKIRQLDGGVVYNQLLKEVYPSLRRVVYIINYSVIPFTVEQGKEVIKEHPEQLSLNEMYLIATTYPQGSHEFNDVFEIAATQYPDDVVANNNAAAVALLKGDMATAKKYLMRIKDTPAAQNNLGVLFFMEGNVPDAVACFKNAKASGSKEAEANLSGIE